MLVLVHMSAYCDRKREGGDDSWLVCNTIMTLSLLCRYLQHNSSTHMYCTDHQPI